MDHRILVVVSTASLTIMLPHLSTWCIQHGIVPLAFGLSSAVQGLTNVACALSMPRLRASVAPRTLRAALVATGVVAGSFFLYGNSMVTLAAARALLGICGTIRLACILESSGDAAGVAKLMGVQVIAAQGASSVSGVLPLVTERAFEWCAVLMIAMNASALCGVFAWDSVSSSAGGTPPPPPPLQGGVGVYVTAALCFAASTYALESYAPWIARDLYGADERDIWWFWTLWAVIFTTVGAYYQYDWRLWRADWSARATGVAAAASIAYAVVGRRSAAAELSALVFGNAVAFVAFANATFTWVLARPDASVILAWYVAASQVGRVVGPLVMGALLQFDWADAGVVGTLATNAFVVLATATLRGPAAMV